MKMCGEINGEQSHIVSARYCTIAYNELKLDDGEGQKKKIMEKWICSGEFSSRNIGQ